MFGRDGKKRCDWSGKWVDPGRLVKVRDPGSGDQYEMLREHVGDFAAAVRGGKR